MYEALSCARVSAIERGQRRDRECQPSRLLTVEGSEERGQWRDRGSEERGRFLRGQWGDRGATASEPTAAATVSEANGSEATGREATGREATGREATGRVAPADALPWEGKTGSRRVHIQVLSLLALLVQSANTDT